ncbi:MAG: DUF4824 family protein [Gammaproteobacteria bacterium]|nr:DUF4824 family protein [Gammaproteobacteria bacterium]
MNSFYRYKVLIAGIVLILLTNVVVITGAIGNRSGQAEAVLELTERELSLRYTKKRENSGISLRLNTNHYAYRSHRGYRGLHWLDLKKLEELGFSTITGDNQKEIRKQVSKVLPKQVYLVLEYDGDAYREALQRAVDELIEERSLFNSAEDNETQKRRLDSAERQLARMKYSASRIYAIDAGLDPVTLRENFPDNTKFFIVIGLVRLSYYGFKDERGPYGGYISKINVNKIHVPLEHRDVFDSLPEKEFVEFRFYPPRYRIKLAYGRRYEPWILNVEKIDRISSK